MRKKYSPQLLLILILFLASGFSAMAQGSTCATIEPFCAGNQSLIFPNCNDQDPTCSATAEPGPDYGCLFTQPYPAWFYLQVDQAGRLDFQIIQNTAFDVDGNPIGQGLDVDFIAWGPFQQGDDLCDYTQLQANNQVACSYSAQPIENFSILNGQPGEIYVLVITNYNRNAGFIKLEQTNVGIPNSGTTDCSIVTTQTGCVGDEFTIDAAVLGATNYLWEYDDGTGFVTIYNGIFPSITVTDGGDYKVTITLPLGNTDVREYEIITNPQPIIASPPLDLSICDNGSTPGVFDLTQNSSVVRGTQDPAFTITYHLNELQAQSGLNPIVPANAYTIVGSNQTIYVRIENVEGNCYVIDSFEIIYEGATATAPTSPHFLCDQDEDGQEVINLEAAFSSAILGVQSPLNYTVTYHISAADAISGENPLGQPYTVSASPTTIHARVQNNNDNDCYATVSFQIILDGPPAVNQTPDPLIACDPGNDGFTLFNLHDADLDITGGDPALTVTYHYTFLDAQTNEGILADPYENRNPYNDQVFARVISGNTSCYNIVELPLQVRDSPILTEPSPYRICDDNQDGFEVFDLTSKASEILGALDPTQFDLYYYVNLLQATTAGEVALTNPDFSQAIASPAAFTNQTINTQTIYVLGVGNTNSTIPNNGSLGCYDIVELQLFVDPQPIAIEPADYHLCDDTLNGSTPTDQISTFNLTSRNLEITGGNSNVTVTWYETPADELADNPIANPEAYQNRAIAPAPINPQTVIARVSNDFECTKTVTLTLVVDQLPTPVEPTPLIVCDLNNDGFAEFDLTLKTAEIAGGDPSMVVTYHETLMDANNGTFPLASPFQNIIAFTQTVYARASYNLPPNATGCFAIVPLDLMALPSPTIPMELPDLVQCDPDGSGFAVFNLTEQEPIIYGNQDPTQLSLTYHTTQEDADLGFNAITGPETYTNLSNPQDIFVRLAFNDGSECYATGKFTLIVSRAVAVVEPTPLELCDDLGLANDGFTTFDLTIKNAEITANAPGMGVSYFLNEIDAQNNENKIEPDTAFINTENPQTLYVRVEDGTTECLGYTTLLLRVLPNPNPVTPAPIKLCDVTIVVGPGPDDEVEIFDLTIREDIILNGGAWDLTYHESYEDAVNNDAPILDPVNYQNTSNSQTIYVRVSNPATDCFEIVKLELIVNPVPDDSAQVEPYIICELNTDGVAEFDLTSKIPEILGDQSSFSLEVSFYLDPIDAANGINRIVNTTAHQNRDLAGNPEVPQTIYTRIENRFTGCYVGGEQSFDLIVQEGAIANAPFEPYVICDNFGANDGIGEFDLEDLANPDVVALRDEILAGQDPLVYIISYYETFENALDDVNTISFPYYNIINPQVIYARVTNSNNLYEPKCFEVVEVILKVQELPNVYLEDEYRLCVDEAGNPIMNEEGATSPPLIDTGLDASIYTFQWSLDGIIIPGEGGPSIIALEGGEYTVIVTEIATGCETIAVTTVVVSSPPLVYSAEVVSSAFADSHSIEVSAEGLGQYVFQLDNGPFQTSNIFENVSPGVHTITIKDVNGCGSVTIEVSVVDYPLYFTPNEDGYHDTWNILGIGTTDPTAKIYIFDRFGKLLKQLSPIGEGWNGTYNGNPMPSSDYWFRVEYKEDDKAKVFTGHFTLKR